MDITAIDNKLNEMVLTGKAMQAFEELYAEDVIDAGEFRRASRGKGGKS